MLSFSALVIAGITAALVITSGVRVSPQAGERAPAAAPTTPGASGELFDVPDSTAKPMTVTPGATVPITVDAVFASGVTLVPPALGDWKSFRSENRPDQFAAHKNSARIVVWQTDVFDSGQSDESLTIAQLNRVGDECADDLSGVSEPEPYTLVGKDGTKLELLRVRVEDCQGAELWVLSRAMPKTGTRFHITVSAVGGVEHDTALMAKLRDVTFTSP